MFSGPRDGSPRSHTPKLKRGDFIGCRREVISQAGHFCGGLGHSVATGEEVAIVAKMRNGAFWCLSFVQSLSERAGFGENREGNGAFWIVQE